LPPQSRRVALIKLITSTRFVERQDGSPGIPIAGLLYHGAGWSRRAAAASQQ
jgi:hypothetical protein